MTDEVVNATRARAVSTRFGGRYRGVPVSLLFAALALVGVLAVSAQRASAQTDPIETTDGETAADAAETAGDARLAQIAADARLSAGFPVFEQRCLRTCDDKADKKAEKAKKPSPREVDSWLKSFRWPRLDLGAFGTLHFPEDPVQDVLAVSAQPANARTDSVEATAVEAAADTDTRLSDGWPVFIQCRETCADEANETSLRAGNLWYHSSRWGKITFGTSGTMRFAGDPAEGREASKFTALTLLTIDFVSGQITFRTSLAAPWENALGIPGLTLDELSVDGSVGGLEVNVGVSASVTIADFASADLDGTLRLTGGHVLIDVAATADVALLGHVFTDTHIDITPRGLHLEGSAGVTDIGTVAVVGDVTLGGGVVAYDITAGLDFTAAGFDLDVPDVSLTGTVGLTANSIPFDADIVITDVGTASVNGALAVEGGNPTLSLSGTSSDLSVGGLDFAVSGAVTVALEGGRLSINGDATIEGIASVAVAGQVWLDSAGVNYDFTGAATIDIAGFDLDVPAIRFVGVTSLDPDAITTAGQVEIAGVGTLDLEVTLTLVGTPALEIDVDTGVLQVAGFDLDASGDVTITEANGRLRIVGHGAVTGLGSLDLDGELWNDAVDGVSFDFDVSGELTVAGFMVPIPATTIAGTVGGAGHQLSVDTTIAIGTVGSVDLVGTLDLDTATLDIEGSGSLSVEGFTIEAAGATSVQLQDDGLYIAGVIEIVGIGDIGLDGRVWVDPAGINYDFIASTTGIQLGGFKIEALAMNIAGVVDVSAGDDGITLSGQTNIGDPEGTSALIDVTGRFWSQDGDVYYGIAGTGTLVLSGFPLVGADFALDGRIGDGFEADVQGDLLLVGLPTGIGLDGTLVSELKPGGDPDNPLDQRLRYDMTVAGEVVIAGFRLASIDETFTGYVEIDQAEGFPIAGRLYIFEPGGPIGPSGTALGPGLSLDVTGSLTHTDDETHYSLSGHLVGHLFGFELHLPDVTLEGTLSATVSDDAVEVGGTMKLIPGLVDIAVTGSFASPVPGGFPVFELTGTETFSLLGFNLQQAGFTIDNSGVNVFTWIGIPGFSVTGFTGDFSIDPQQGLLYSLTGFTNTSFAGISSGANLTFDNAGMHMSTHLIFGGWLNSSFNGTIGSDGSYDMVAANGLNLSWFGGLPLVDSSSSVRLKSTVPQLTATTTTSVGGLGLITMSGSISSAGMTLSYRSPVTGYTGGCITFPAAPFIYPVPALQLRGCFYTFSEFTLSTSAGFGVGGGGYAQAESRWCTPIGWPWEGCSWGAWGAPVGVGLWLETWEAAGAIHQKACAVFDPLPAACLQLW